MSNSKLARLAAALARRENERMLNRITSSFDGVRRVAPGFEPVVLPHTGHYPMLECPEEFNRALGVTPSVPAA